MTTSAAPRHVREPEYAVLTTALRKTYRSRRGRQVAVENLELRVPRGGVHGFLGPNGSGKTTTIRMLLGLISADSGTMSVFGRPVPEQLPEVIGSIGAIVEQPKFFPAFSGHRNLELLATGIGAPRSRVAEVLAEVGLAERARDRFKTYSLGMRQRLAIAATLLKEPELLIFDEPTNGLDPAGIHEIRATMRALADSGRTVLVSSHILSEVQQVADTVSIIGRGRLLAEGQVDDILARGGAASVRVGVPDPARAAQLLTAAGFRTAPGTPGTVIVSPGIGPDGRPVPLDASRVTFVLAQQGIYLAELAWQRADLEQVFLSLTAQEHLGANVSGTAASDATRATPARRGPAVMRLVGAELRRLLARRMALVTGIVLLVAVGLFQLAVNSEASPPSPDQVAQQRQYYQQAHDEWARNHDAGIADCVAQGETQANCEAAFREPTPADFSLTATPFDRIGQVALLLSASLAMLAAYLVGSSFIGAEYSTGSLANWLTFVPERLKVYGSKLLAVVLASAVGGAVVNFLMLGLAALITKAYGGALTGVGALAGTGGRAVVMAVVAGVLGFVLALVSRHTVAALGAVLGYLLVATVLNLLAQDADGPLAWLPPWMPEQNVQAFLQHGSTYAQYRTTVTADGTSSDSVERHIAFGHSAVYWLVVLVVAVVGAALVFRRRDVT